MRDRLVPDTTREEYEEGIRVAQAYLHSLGITAWQDAIVGDGILTSDSFRAYLSVEARGERVAPPVFSATWQFRLAEFLIP